MVTYKVREYTFDFIENQQKKYKNMIFIMESYGEGSKEVSVPSRLTEFISKKNTNINTQKSSAHLICSFMNYIKEQVEVDEDFVGLKEEGLFGLNWLHASKFLTYLGTVKMNRFKTVVDKENEIIRFYEFLIKKNLLQKDVVLEYYTYHDPRTDGIKIKPISPFQNSVLEVQYPSKESIKVYKMKDMDRVFWEALLEVADSVAPEICLGIFFQIMSGLRVGEVVNLTLDSVKVDRAKNNMSLDVRDRQKQLFQDRKINISKSQVKRQRDKQIVLNALGDIIDRWDRHLRLRQHILSKSKEPTSALFVDSLGQAMSGNSYINKFDNVKREFLKLLKDTSYKHYKEFSESRWKTHIGRGIFTNFALKKGLVDVKGVPSAKLLANIRGDKSTESAQEYIDALTLINSISEKLNNINDVAEILERNKQ